MYSYDQKTDATGALWSGARHDGVLGQEHPRHVHPMTLSLSKHPWQSTHLVDSDFVLRALDERVFAAERHQVLQDVTATLVVCIVSLATQTIVLITLATGSDENTAISLVVAIFAGKSTMAIQRRT